MKKNLLFGMLLTFLLIGCGEKIPTTSKSEKEKIVTSFSKDENARKKYIEITSELEKLAKDGNEKAEKELKEWEEVKKEYMVKNMFEMSEETKAIAEKHIKSGKLW